MQAHEADLELQQLGELAGPRSDHVGDHGYGGRREGSVQCPDDAGFLSPWLQDFSRRYPISVVIGVRHVLMGNDHRQGQCWILEQGRGFPNMRERTILKFIFLKLKIKFNYEKSLIISLIKIT